jgi:hypothetical protein
MDGVAISAFDSLSTFHNFRTSVHWAMALAIMVLMASSSK